MHVRAAEDLEIDQLARVWFDGWQDAHAQIVPAELTRLRTLESFRDRLQAALPHVRVIGPSGAPVDSPSSRGTSSISSSSRQNHEAQASRLR